MQCFYNSSSSIINTMRSLSFVCSTVALISGSASAFTTGSASAQRSSSVALQAQTDPSSSCDRAAFLKTSLATVAAITASCPAAFADDDLTMPTPGEQKVADVSLLMAGNKRTFVCLL